MSKKQQRIKYLVGIHRALNHPLKGAKADNVTYSADTVKRILKTVEAILKLDNITPMVVELAEGDDV